MTYIKPKEVKSKVPIQGSKRQIKLLDGWLLYNYDIFHGWYWTKKSAIRDANYMAYGNFNDKELPEYFEVLRGSVQISFASKIIKTINNNKKDGRNN